MRGSAAALQSSPAVMATVFSALCPPRLVRERKGKEEMTYGLGGTGVAGFCSGETRRRPSDPQRRLGSRLGILGRHAAHAAQAGGTVRATFLAQAQVAAWAWERGERDKRAGSVSHLGRLNSERSFLFLYFFKSIFNIF